MTLDRMHSDGIALRNRSAVVVLESPEEIPGTGVVIGIDPGARSVGVAVSDPERRVASPIGRIRRRTFRELADNLRDRRPPLSWDSPGSSPARRVQVPSPHAQ